MNQTEMHTTKRPTSLSLTTSTWTRLRLPDCLTSALLDSERCRKCILSLRSILLLLVRRKRRWEESHSLHKRVSSQWRVGQGPLGEHRIRLPSLEEEEEDSSE